MTVSFNQPPPETEAYPGEQLALLRKVSAQLDQLHAELETFRPILERFRGGGLLGGRRRQADHVQAERDARARGVRI